MKHTLCTQWFGLIETDRARSPVNHLLVGRHLSSFDYSALPLKF